MPDSPSSSERRRQRAARSAPSTRCALVAAGLICLLAGCATVRPEDKEYLAEPAMTWSNAGLAARQEAHVIENREGSSGGGKTKAGGCGCN